MFTFFAHDKKLHIACEGLANCGRAFTFYVVFCYNDGTDKIIGSMTSDEYFRNKFLLTENQVHIVTMRQDLIPGKDFEFSFSIDPNRVLFSCWIFFDLHQKHDIPKKIQLGKNPLYRIVVGADGIRLVSN